MNWRRPHLGTSSQGGGCPPHLVSWIEDRGKVTRNIHSSILFNLAEPTVEVRTDNGHELRARFHWHVEGHGIRHAYIRELSGGEMIDKAYASPIPTDIAA